MTGSKGKSGGSRIGAGRRAKNTDPAADSTLAVSAQARQELRILTLRQRAVRNCATLTQRQILEELIHAAWLDYDAQIQSLAEQAHEAPL
jgi:hypothetical protein